MKNKTQKVVEKVVDSYRKAGKLMAKAERNNMELNSWMNQDTFDDTADAIEAAYNAGNFDNIPESELDELMEKYGATDIYHLLASYFNKTGKIINVEQD